MLVYADWPNAHETQITEHFLKPCQNIYSTNMENSYNGI